MAFTRSCLQTKERDGDDPSLMDLQEHIYGSELQCNFWESVGISILGDCGYIWLQDVLLDISLWSQINVT